METEPTNFIYIGKRLFWALVIALACRNIIEPPRIGRGIEEIFDVQTCQLFFSAVASMWVQWYLTDKEKEQELAEKDKIIKICPVCGKEFPGKKSSSVKYCSQECLYKKQP